MDQADTMVAVSYNLSAINVFIDCLNTIYESVSELFSFEILAHRGSVFLCFTASGETLDIISSLLLTVYESAELETVQDQTLLIGQTAECAVGEIGLLKDSIYPLWVYPHKKDPMLPIFQALNGLRHEYSALIQFVAQPAPDTAGMQFQLAQRRNADSFLQLFRSKYWFKRWIRATVRKAITSKINSKLFHLNIRVAAWTDSKHSQQTDSSVQGSIRRIIQAMTYVNGPDINGIKLDRLDEGPEAIRTVQERQMNSPFLLSSAEFSTLFHIPWASALRNTTIVQSLKVAPPPDLPMATAHPEITKLALTNFRERRSVFGIRKTDRQGHCYINGLDGAGKSTLIQQMASQDISDGEGIAFIDPQGDIVEKLLRSIPENRIKDVVLFDPTDTSFPVSFNPLEKVAEQLRPRVAMDFVQMFRKLMGQSWNDELAFLVNNVFLALLSVRGATLLSVQRLLTSTRYQTRISGDIADFQVRKFWKDEYATWSENHWATAIAPLKDTIDSFLGHDAVRHVTCQPINRLNFRQIIDERKILLVKLPVHLLGSDHAALLGDMIIAKLYQTAMSRVDIPAARRSRLFFYIDEFHRFAPLSFCNILSESRKFGINLILANQSLELLSADIRQGIFGNVANLICFNTGQADARVFVKEFQPRFCIEDLTQQKAGEFIIKMSINGAIQPAFSAHNPEIRYPRQDLTQLCIDSSRAQFSAPRTYASSVMDLWESLPVEHSRC